MSRYVLDTDTLTLAQNNDPNVLRNLAAHPPADIALAALSLQEQMKGWLGRLNRLRDPQQIADWYERLVNGLFPVWRRFVLITFSVPAIHRFEHLRSLSLKVGSMDLRIAATALENGLIVVTRNRSDFGRVPGLTIEDWSI